MMIYTFQELNSLDYNFCAKQDKLMLNKNYFSIYIAFVNISSLFLWERSDFVPYIIYLT